MKFSNEQIGWLIINFQDYWEENTSENFTNKILEMYNEDEIDVIKF